MTNPTLQEQVANTADIVSVLAAAMDDAFRRITLLESELADLKQDVAVQQVHT